MTAVQVQVSRTIDATPAEAYRAFLDPDKLRRWFCPDGFEVTSIEVDERVGGRHRTELSSREYGRHRFDAEIFELVPEERIVLSWRFADLDPPRESEESVVTVTFRAVDEDRTEVTLTHSRLTGEWAADQASIDEGWTEALSHLAALYERS